MSFSTTADDDTSTTTVAVICPPDSPCLNAAPKNIPHTRLLIHNDMESFQRDPHFADVSAIMFVALGGNVSLLPQIFDAAEEAPKKIKWVHSLFAGVDALAPFIKSHLLQKKHQHVPLTNGRGAFSESLAEYVMTAALHFNKQISRVQQNRIARTWDKFVMPTLAGKTIGFVGFGHIGQTTARLARQFGMKVVCVRNDKTKQTELADTVYGNEEKEALLAESDFVVSVLPGTPQTLDYFGSDEFAMMKPSGVFISIGRGTVVDEDALANALMKGQISGAALDVFKVEPLPTESPLWDCENLLLTAHNADLTEDYFELGWKVWEKNLEAIRQGESPITLVDKNKGY